MKIKGAQNTRFIELILQVYIAFVARIAFHNKVGHDKDTQPGLYLILHKIHKLMKKSLMG